MSSDADVAIEVAGAGRTHRLDVPPFGGKKQSLFGGRRRREEFTALSGVDLTLRRGEAIGIVGVNGAGKSTLMQLIAGTLAPTQGRVRTRGRVAVLLEPGSGFKPELTGRENVYLTGAALGLDRGEIGRRLDSVVEFAGIGAHMDQPVRTYSTVMRVRLAFSIAIGVDPDILIVDEVASPGDDVLERRLHDRLLRIRERGAAVLLCSRTVRPVEMLCDRALWLHEGRVREVGRAPQVLGRYQAFLDGLGESSGHSCTAARVPKTLPADLAGADRSDGACAGPGAPPQASPDVRGAAGYWDGWQARHSAARQTWSDWGDHPEVLRLVFNEAFGGEAADLLGWLKLRFGALAGRALSLCCGDGSFERSLVDRGVFSTVDGIDLSPGRIESARAAAGEYADRLSYRVGNVDDAQFGKSQYDFVVAKASLHHLSNLEAVFEAIARSLKPGGRLVTLDFFGPTRFQWTDRQLEEVNRFLDDEVPPALRLRADGSVYRAARPTLDEMISLDPSEAVRSGELYGLLRMRFEPEVDLPLGGTMLNLILHGDVVNDYDADSDAHNRVIRRAFARERELMERGEIGSDFRLIVARPRQGVPIG